MRGALGSAMEPICPDSDQTKDKRSWQNSTINLEKFIRRTKVALPEIGLSGRPWPSFSNFLPTSFTVESMSVTTAALDGEDRRQSHRRRQSRATS